MAFTAFNDDLAFVVVMILAAATILAYTGIMAFLAMRRNDAAGLKSILKSSAIPIGGIGVISGALGLWVEVAWPFLLSDGMGAYDIFFGDAFMLFAMVCIVYAAVNLLGLKLQYAGLFGFIAGSTVAAYGYWGYTTVTASGVGLTKDPYQTFLLYLGFAAAGVFALPATLVVDWYLAHPGPIWASLTSPTASASSRRASLGNSIRAAQGMPGAGSGVSGADEDELTSVRFRLPAYAYILTLAFPLFMVLAAIAAWLYLGAIVPGHLTSPP